MKKVAYKILLSILFPAFCSGQWSQDPSQNLQILAGSIDPKMITDGNGGAIVVGTSFTVRPHHYAQRVDKYGNVLWDSLLQGIQTSNVGVQQSHIGSGEKNPQVVSDGVGGVYVAFNAYWVVGFYTEPKDEMYTVRTYLQRIDKDGNRRFGEEGIPLLYRAPVDTSYQIIVALVSDGTGGVYNVFMDLPTLYPGSWYSHRRWYVNRIDSTGNNLFGYVLELPLEPREDPSLICYEDDQGGLSIYVRLGVATSDRFLRINNKGEIILNKEISIVVPHDIHLEPPFVDFVNQNGLITFVWWNYWNNTACLQRLDKNGEKLWGELPLVLNTRSEFRMGDIITNEDDVIISWDDERTGKIDSYAQRINKTGQFLWGENGLSVSTIDVQFRSYALLTSAKNKNTIFLSFESRDDSTAGMFAQKLDIAGNRIWEGDDILVSNRPNALKNGHQFPNTISDGAGGFIFCWSEIGMVRGTFIQQVNHKGDLGIVTRVKSNPNKNMSMLGRLFQNYPNPFNSETKIKYKVNRLSDVYLNIIDIVGREVITLVNEKQFSGYHFVVWNGKNQRGGEVASGIYFYQLMIGDELHVCKLIYLR